MKVATVSLLTLIGGNPSARPAIGTRVGAEGDDKLCQEQWVKDIIASDYGCANPGHKPEHEFTKVKKYWFDKKFDCTTRCCGGSESSDGKHKCKCVHAGKPHGGGDWSQTCCSMDVNREVASDRWTGNNGTHCGCAYVGDRLAYEDAKETDCCSGKWHSKDNRTCIPNECTANGQTPDDKICCGYVTGQADGTGTITAKNEDGTCKCVPSTKQLDDHYQLSQPTDCCSGALVEGTVLGVNGTCGCISNVADPLPKGASASDCCGGVTETNDDGEFCKAGSCSTKGGSAAGGLHCCSGEKEGERCQCLLGGQSLPEGANATECCTTTGDGKCGFKGAGVQPGPFHSSKAAQCASNITTPGGYCTCIKAGVQPRHEIITGEFCCSEDLADGKCGCVHTNKTLQTGADESDCCSRTADHGTCSCAFPGRPAWSGNSTGAECCGGYQVGGICGCNEAGQMNSPPGSCCGGFKNSTTEICVCIPDGTAVARFVRKEACCGGAIQNGTCTSDVSDNTGAGTGTGAAGATL